MKRKILFLTPSFAPSGVTGAIRPSKFAKYFDRFGWDVNVLTFYHQDNIHHKLLKDLKNVSIVNCGKPKKIIFNDLGVSYLFQAYKKAILLARELRPDYVLVSMPAFINSILAWIIKKRFNINYILDYRDLWVGDPYPARGLKHKAFKIFSKIIEPIILKSSYLSYYVSKPMLKDQQKLYPWLKKKKTLVISTGYDHEDIKNILKSKKKNGYLAHIGNADLDMNLIDFVEIIKNKKVQKLLIKKRLKFLFVGSKNNFLKRTLNKNIRGFFKFKNYISHNQALKLMADSNGLIILGSNSSQRLNRKVFEYTALNSNIFYLGNKKSPTAKIVYEFQGVVSSTNNKVKKMLFYLNNLSYGKLKLSEKYCKEKLVKDLIENL